jgi:hypothetical protein
MIQYLLVIAAAFGTGFLAVRFQARRISEEINASKEEHVS